MSTRREDAPTGDVEDNSYISRQGNKNEPLPVQADGDRIEDPIDASTADSDEQLGKPMSTRTGLKLNCVRTR